MNQTIHNQAKKEFSEVNRNIWIQEFISRRENPIILALYYLMLMAGSFVTFQCYFTQGSPCSLLSHIVALFALPTVLAIVHFILNRVFKKDAERRCPVKTTACDIENPDAFLAEFNELKHRLSKGFDAASFALLTPVAIVLCFGYFAWLRKLPIPDGCILYLIFLCVLLFVYGTIVVISTSQSLLPPLSREVKNALSEYAKKQKQQAEHAEKERLKKQATAQITANQPDSDNAGKEEAEPVTRPYSPTTEYHRSANRPMSDYDKWAYIRDNCYGMFSWSGIQTIENDPNLTTAQKEELKTYLKVYGD